MSKIRKIKKYYRIEFELTSPLAVGSGENNITDKDIVRDGRGIPYIPGSSLAGVYRSLFSGETQDRYFGQELTQERIDVASKKGKAVLEDSSILVYDAHMQTAERGRFAKRDMVALDEYKTAIPGAKFDFEILEPGAVFVTYIEQNMDSADQQYVINEIADAWMKGKITVGAKTGRGYGHTRGVAAESAMYDLSDTEQRDSWLGFDMYEETWSLGNTDPKCDETCLSSLKAEDQGYDRIREVYGTQEIQLTHEEKCTVILDLVQQGGISIRQYTTNVDEEDYRQLTARSIRGEENEDKNAGTPVIPGTSWAGAFRAQMEKLDPGFGRKEKLTEKLFGSAKNREKRPTESGDGNGTGGSSRTRIGFSESRITGGRWVAYTRNAIDRFTGGTVDGALYSEKTYYCGRTSLMISCDFSDREDQDNISAEERRRLAGVLAAAILDLDNGYMAVGGLTAVGRGLFRAEKITVDGKSVLDRKAGEEKAASELYTELVRMIAGKGEAE